MRTKTFNIHKLAVLAALGTLATGASASTFYYNQVGYDANMPKTVIVKAQSGLDGAEFSVTSNGVTAFTGKLGKGSNPDNWNSDGQVFYVADFSEVTAPGSYILTVPSAGSEVSLTIADKALAANTLKSVMDYFYNDRADKSPILGWDQSVSVYGSSGVTRDVHGGWYDASGDVSKYFSHLSYANYLNPQQIPLTVWALAFAAEKMPTTLTANPSTVTAVDEAIYGADFLVRMQDESGFFYMTVFDNWGAGSRYLCAFSGSDGIKSADYKTAFREGGGMAIAALARASTLGKSGDYTSEQYLAAAKKGFEHLQAKQSIGGTCEYCDNGKENIIDDYTALLAATELFAATNDTTYLNAARARAANLEGRLSDDGYFWSDDAKTRPFWHASDAGLPIVALSRYAEIESNQTVDYSDWVCPDCVGCECINQNQDRAEYAVKKHLNWLISVTNEIDNPFGYARQTVKTQGAIKNSFFIPHDNESNYWWQGEDARLASLSAAALYAARVLNSSDTAISKYAADQLDWILGKNPYGVCMMYGMGTKNPAKYDGTSNYDATLEGGIANGISGKNTDGSGIVYDDVAAVGMTEEPWNNWRWIEQWLPHSTWYLMALATRYDEVTTVENKFGGDAIAEKITIAKFDIRLQNRTLTVNLLGARASTISLYDLNGQLVINKRMAGMSATMDLTTLKSGIYMVKAGRLAKKIAIK